MSAKIKKILIVDDELDWIKILTNVVTNAGYAVESAINGKQAVGAYIESLHKQDPISLILLDVRLPDIDGVEVLDIIRKEEEWRGIPESLGVPIIMISAYDPPRMDPSLVKGRYDYILKSYYIDEILKKIKEKTKD